MTDELRRHSDEIERHAGEIERHAGEIKRHTDRGPVIGGVVFIVVGVFLLLEKLGVLPAGFVLHFWPSIFICAAVTLPVASVSMSSSV